MFRIVNKATPDFPTGRQTVIDNIPFDIPLYIPFKYVAVDKDGMLWVFKYKPDWDVIEQEWDAVWMDDTHPICHVQYAGEAKDSLIEI